MIGSRWAALTLACLSAVACSPGANGSQPCRSDALQVRVRDELSSYVGWLQRNDAKGYLGEVGWPGDRDAARWNAVGRAWFGVADAADLPVTAWAAGEWWPADYPLAIYRARGAGGPLRQVGRQARVVERHAHDAGGARGVADAGGAFGAETAGYSAEQPGAYGQAYAYPTGQSLAFLAGRGLSLVRLAFTWERIQPRLGGPLSAAELTRLRTVVRSAHAAGLSVVLDLHNYGRYRVAGSDGSVDELVLGSTGLPAADLADVWRRLARAFRDEPGIWGYGLMNEPHDLPGPRGGAVTWERASQRAVDAIRSVGDRTQVLVAGASWSRVADWTGTHPRAWITDPARSVRYEAHQYFDADGSGSYRGGYAAALAAARSAGAPSGC